MYMPCTNTTVLDFTPASLAYLRFAQSIVNCVEVNRQHDQTSKVFADDQAQPDDQPDRRSHKAGEPVKTFEVLRAYASTFRAMTSR
jgi:hypothetical protein